MIVVVELPGKNVGNGEGVGDGVAPNGVGVGKGVGVATKPNGVGVGLGASVGRNCATWIGLPSQPVFSSASTFAFSSAADAMPGT